MENTLHKLEDAAKGLYMLSETDAPFEIVDLGQQAKDTFTQEHLLLLLGKPTETPIEMQELEYFLRNMTKTLEGISEEQLNEIAKFRTLQRILVSTLSEVKVYRIGQIRIEAYILGWDNENRLVGLKTFQVET